MVGTTARAKRIGLSLVELLIVIAIVGAIFLVVGTFFVQQANLSRRTQATNELNIRLRGVAEGVVQDLQLAGSRAVVDSQGRSRYVSLLDIRCTDALSGARDRCVIVSQTGGGFIATVFYASSLFLPDGADLSPFPQGAPPSEVCRRIDYHLVDATVYRSDVACDAAVPNDVQIRSFANEFATGIGGITVEFVCDDATTVGSAASDCYDLGPNSFVREGRVTVTGNELPLGLSGTVELAAGMSNMRPPLDFGDE